MDSIRRRLRACAWTALVVFGWMALAPVLAQATPAPAAGWAEVCTAQGLERLAIEEALGRTAWHQGQAADILGLSPRTLHRKIRGLGLKRPD